MSDLTGLPDEELATRAIDEHLCLDVLLDRYVAKIRACAWKMVGIPNEVEDLTQEAVLRLIKSLPGFQARSSFATWVYRVAHHTCVDSYRRRAKVPPVPARPEDGVDDPWFGLEAPATDPEALFEDAIAECYVEQALRTLPADHARIATLRLIDGWSNAEIAAELGLSVDAVKGKLKRARTRLRTFLAVPRTCPICRAGEFTFDERGLR